MRELRETEYRFREAFVMNSSTATTTFGWEATPWDAVLAATLRSYGWTGAPTLVADVAPAPAGLRPAAG